MFEKRFEGAFQKIPENIFGDSGEMFKRFLGRLFKKFPGSV